MSKHRILIIEDDADIVLILRLKLESEGYEAHHAGNAKQGWEKIITGEFNGVLLDHNLPDRKGVELLEQIAHAYPDLPVIFMTAFSSVPLAVKAMRVGAYDYLTKPFNLDEVQIVLRKAMEMKSLRSEVNQIRQQNRETFNFSKIIGRGGRMSELLEMCRTVAESEASSILITGESGTGKNLIAQAIHYNSRRANWPFMTITCTALPEQLLESELFGHEKGAFTDAKERKRGLFEMGNGGTIFLDEIGDLPMQLQAKLLGVLESRSFRRVGSLQDLAIDARFIAATNQHLQERIREKAFRGDLYYRLNVIQLEVPALRDRREDIPELVRYYQTYFNKNRRHPIDTMCEAAMDALIKYDWPGNVRELRNVIERAMILCKGDELTLVDLPRDVVSHIPGHSCLSGFTLPADGIDLEAVEKDFLRQALERTDGNQTKAAQLLGLSRDKMRYRVKQL
ncbi:sigma-54-dependent transcriptional regulator [Acanthopleuribacter pedis]|uniref:Sigma-54-dependent Fis family transcriptional regulator n=1 Tax=Acanthopleuribacter pedis TaxID=442870 RepID=A0A8J7Q9S4_9BACT|nr:sigma-54 dependent transcriptional regulator [Acanthopleuribacter pedis]MBO1320049.1 sigma-54-dependent Fis family transcriptional regulator [Acanthopleuribacter pedis]